MWDEEKEVKENGKKEQTWKKTEEEVRRKIAGKNEEKRGGVIWEIRENEKWGREKED